ncbi:ATP-dependent endonuclease [Curtobacterium sp. MCBD17_032]|uniref:ATP-dependent nuclease n=1 Tax=Curtobacterium sp. MCBD17_032 TaxID=2175659 RepID=UPI000DA7CD5F|nr:ATP-binding protein [Curtobacterium sp. MCBD17_032]PZE86160.1 ATP-dependent endonuclease [Curtobacterium sp. MCBD17_032]
MQVRTLRVRNFRGARQGHVDFSGDALLVGGNAAGKSTICEALDLALGAERLMRRPPIDEHDFYASAYLDDDGVPTEIEVHVVLTNLSPEAERRFANHLRKWNPETSEFADETADADGGLTDEQLTSLPWALPVLFVGRYNLDEDDFEGATFFSHPIRPGREDELGGGRRSFTREDKRYCGFLYLRPNRTGRKALSFERGSLLDTIFRLEDSSQLSLWETLRASLSAIEVADESKLGGIVKSVHERLANFVALTPGNAAVTARASDLTRANIRETMRLFMATAPGDIPVPFDRLSTGTLNLIVFGLLTYIAELRGNESVIFALEEPEIAIPPHSQRRLVDFVKRRMGQAIITSHSPYVIERFDPDQILVLTRDTGGHLLGSSIALPPDFKEKRYRENRRQFAEAILAAGVLVVEGSTEASVFPVVADVMDADPSEDFVHPDLLGLSILDANNDVSVPLYAPVFKGMGKRVYGIHDRPTEPLSEDLMTKTEQFDEYQEIDQSGVEDLLIAELPTEVKLRFLLKAQEFADYPSGSALDADSTASTVDKTLRKVLKSRKGANYGYAARLVSEATKVSELPQSYVELLRLIHQDLTQAGNGAQIEFARDASSDNRNVDDPTVDDREQQISRTPDVASRSSVERPDSGAPDADADADADA